MASAGWAVVAATLLHGGVALYRQDLAISWQLVELPVLARDPGGSVWHLHTQPPLYNLVVGSVLRWSPFPPIGTLFALSLATLWGTVALLADLLVGWRTPPVAAGAVAAVAVCSPTLLVTLGWGGYEVPVVFLLVASIWWFQRHLHRPGAATLVGLAVALTALAMTRSLFHPGFVVAVLGLAATARRARWEHVAVAVAVPLLVVGGWMAKNAVLFDTATTSSWFGFNLQRGVVAPMERGDVERAVADGDVSPQALLHPWGQLRDYPGALDGCRPAHDHPAASRQVKYELADSPIPNYNHECYLPLYARAGDDAAALVRRHPGRYLRTRATVLASSFAVTTFDRQGPIFGLGNERRPERTWIDAVADRALVPITVELDLRSWNLPPFGDAPIVLRLSPVLALLAVGVGIRGVVGVVRLARVGWRDRAQRWATDELVWVLVGATVWFVVGVGDLLEFGENGRFRAVVDPLLVGAPLAALARSVAGRWPAADRPASDDGGGSADPASAPAASDPAPAPAPAPLAPRERYH